APKPYRTLTKAAGYFNKLLQEIDIEKYKLDKYKELFMLGSFQAMFDADLAYHDIYKKCAQNAQSKSGLLLSLHEEEKLPLGNPECFDSKVYRQSITNAIAE